MNQCNPGPRQRFANLTTDTEKVLLWFQPLPWDHRIKSGRALWDDLCMRYQRGKDWTREAMPTWATLTARIDREEHVAVA